MNTVAPRRHMPRRVKLLIAFGLALALAIGFPLQAQATITYNLIFNHDVNLNQWYHVNTSLTYTAVKTSGNGYTASARVSGVGTATGSPDVVLTFSSRLIYFDCMLGYPTGGVVNMKCYVGTGT